MSAGVYRDTRRHRRNAHALPQDNARRKTALGMTHGQIMSVSPTMNSAERMEDEWSQLMPITHDAFTANGRVGP